LQEYEIALFVHFVGLAGLFAGIGVEVAMLHFAQRSSDVQSVRTLIAVGEPAGKMIPAFALLILLSGIYMVEDVWDWEKAWISMSLLAFLVLLAMGPLINGRRMKAIRTAAERSPDGPVPKELRSLLDDPVLTTSERTMLLAAIGLVYLMTTKPDAGGTIIALLVFIGLGLILSAPAWLGRQPAGSPGEP
jgi:hypothetical protein